MTEAPERVRDRDLPEIVLVSVAEIGSGALEAHLLELARRLSPHVTVHWGALASPRLLASAAGRRLLASFERQARGALSGSLLVHPVGPRYTAIALAGTVLGMRLRGVVTRPPILHARGYVAALAALAAKRLVPGSRVLHDVRGDRPAEVRLHGGEYSPERVADLEAHACRASDGHLAVSRRLADVLERRHGVKSVVFASAADTEHFRPDPLGRARVRASLGVGGEFLLGFIGSCAPWQRPEGVIALYRKLETLRPGARWLILSPDQDAWAARLADAGLAFDTASRPERTARVHLRSAQHDEVPAWISACDATALLRDDDDVNRVASPIKFAESLACGVPVLMSSRIGDASDLVAARGVGACFESLVLADPRDEDRLAAYLARWETDPAGIASACRDAAVREWSWSSQVQGRLEVYRRLATGRSMPTPEEQSLAPSEWSLVQESP